MSQQPNQPDKRQQRHQQQQESQPNCMANVIESSAHQSALNKTTRLRDANNSDGRLREHSDDNRNDHDGHGGHGASGAGQDKVDYDIIEADLEARSCLLPEATINVESGSRRLEARDDDDDDDDDESRHSYSRSAIRKVSEKNARVSRWLGRYNRNQFDERGRRLSGARASSGRAISSKSDVSIDRNATSDKLIGETTKRRREEDNNLDESRPEENSSLRCSSVERAAPCDDSGETLTGSCVAYKQCARNAAPGSQRVAQRACSEAPLAPDKRASRAAALAKRKGKATNRLPSQPNASSRGLYYQTSGHAKSETACISRDREQAAIASSNLSHKSATNIIPQPAASTTPTSSSQSLSSASFSHSSLSSSRSTTSSRSLEPASIEAKSAQYKAALCSPADKLTTEWQLSQTSDTSTCVGDQQVDSSNRKQVAIELADDASRGVETSEDCATRPKLLDSFRSIFDRTTLVRAFRVSRSSLNVRSFITDLQSAIKFNTDGRSYEGDSEDFQASKSKSFSILRGDNLAREAAQVEEIVGAPSGNSTRERLSENTKNLQKIISKGQSIKMKSISRLQEFKQHLTNQQDDTFEDRRCSSIAQESNFDSSTSSGNNYADNNSGPTSSQAPRETTRACSQSPGEPNPSQQTSSNLASKRLDSNFGQHSAGQLVVSDDNQGEKREQWGMNVEFLLAVIGFAVDLGNVWRFPYICYKNGGGAFLIPYTVMFFLGGVPIFYLEMSAGQYFSSGCLTVWQRISPVFKGIGYAMCILNFYTGLYYNTIISWAVYFFVESFANQLPWTSCDHSWNRPDCRTIEQRHSSLLNSTSDSVRTSNSTITYSRPTTDYFERQVLQVDKSSGVNDLGEIRLPLAIYLAIVFICIYFAIWKGVKSTGKAVWITALLPYLVLFPLLIRGVFLEGARIGIEYYLYPDWSKITDATVWVEAAKQIFFSLGPGFGTLLALSSYNKFNHNCERDALIAAAVNYFASFISGLVIFAVLGHMARLESVDVSEVATEGPGLVFQVYPEGLATMSFSALWSVCFFAMVISLGIDSTFGGLESVITGLCDEYPLLKRTRGAFIGLLIVAIYIFSLPTTTYGGRYVIYLLESYGTSLSLLFIVMAESIVICWVYGVERFSGNLQEMTGKRPAMYWRICWKFISPTILVVIFLAACAQECDKYNILKDGDYTYPRWAPVCGLVMTGSSILLIPIYAVYYLKNKATGATLRERLANSIKPIDNDRRTFVEGISRNSEVNDANANAVI